MLDWHSCQIYYPLEKKSYDLSTLSIHSVVRYFLLLNFKMGVPAPSHTLSAS